MSASSFPRSVILTARSDTKGKSVFSWLTDWQNEEKFHHGFFFFFFFLIIQLIIISSGPLLSLSFRLSLPKFLSIDSQKQKKFQFLRTALSIVPQLGDSKSSIIIEVKIRNSQF
ncbi:unnamed protein product [Arabidopsis thaliana]|uniref:At5g50645 n=1 Tax=Arabidopsis thaliana TaxID=3702 RepID=Q9FGP4_ARATH|nr:uncharacterized protein AT5G50540 [Arabidopsis thaliana]AAS46628.1 At5g50645 [Arabidopsis thaliana]AAS76721.1 At5g50645 [Arabidopsis thaliana]AED95956.1 transmembrane protein [Arabidopsis thaliana]BAB09139.1 unnamed protein product [Arabidopsis thaliana]|eukprot:NP_568737.1 transmembrane protein [Arabidopsis thaliana]